MRILLIVVILAAALLAGCEYSEVYCMDAESGEVLSFTEAKSILMSSECAKHGQFKESYVCNAVTGTLWVDLDIEMTGCSPACVVDVSNKSAEINWRCTGLLPIEVPEEPAGAGSLSK